MFSLPYDFNSIFFPLADFIGGIKDRIHVTYTTRVNGLSVMGKAFSWPRPTFPPPACSQPQWHPSPKPSASLFVSASRWKLTDGRAPLNHFYFHGNEDCVFLTHLLPTKEDVRIYGLTEDLELVSNAICMDEQTRLSFLHKWTQI